MSTTEELLEALKIVRHAAINDCVLFPDYNAILRLDEIAAIVREHEAVKGFAKLDEQDKQEIMRLMEFKRRMKGRKEAKHD